MESILQFLESIGSAVDTAVNFFKQLINNLHMLVEYIGLAASTSYNLVASLPTWLQAFGTATVLICVLYLILGRQTGGGKSD